MATNSNLSTGDNPSAVYQDPAEFLLTEKKYHDWHVTIVDTKSKAEEVIGVHSVDLIAHSSVFRTMMSDPKWVNTKNVEISDISAEVFKLVLTYVYGGKLPEISRSVAFELAFAADKYFIPRLVNEAGKQLVPTTLEEFYPALNVVGFFSCPDLEPHLVKFIQKDTETIMKSEEMLELPGQCWVFILKQDLFNIEEVQVWRHLMKWAEHQVAKHPEKTLRRVLQEPLRFVRLATLSQEEIAKEVLPTTVLTNDEMLSLLNAVIIKQKWDLPGFCGSLTGRKLINVHDKLHIFKALGSWDPSEYYTKPKSGKTSSFTIKPLKDLELHSYVVLAKPKSEIKASNTDHISCSLVVEDYASDDEHITLSFKQPDGSFVRLKANNTYYFNIEFPSEHPACYMHYGDGTSCTGEDRKVKDVMTVKFCSPIHVREIHYRILP